MTRHSDFILRRTTQAPGRFSPIGNERTWYRSEIPITWAEARDLLVAAQIIDPNFAGLLDYTGGWTLDSSPSEAELYRVARKGGRPSPFPRMHTGWTQPLPIDITFSPLS